MPKKQSKRARQSSNGSDSSTASSKPEPTWVEDVFEGKLTTETRCLFCETVKKTDEPFLNLSVEVGQNASLTSCTFSGAGGWGVGGGPRLSLPPLHHTRVSHADLCTCNPLHVLVR